MAWTSVQATLNNEQMEAITEEALNRLTGLPLRVLRNRGEAAAYVRQAILEATRALQMPSPTPAQMQAMVAHVLSRVGGLGFLQGLLPPQRTDLTDIMLNPDGSVWVRRKGEAAFEQLDIRPSRDEVWRAVDALLAPHGRACTEATPSVDVPLRGDATDSMGHGRVKVIHPVVAVPGNAEKGVVGYPKIAIRLFEPKPVTPDQILAWDVMPPFVMEFLLQQVAKNRRVIIVGGTGVGKTTLLSALGHGIPEWANIVTCEDPKEIWLPHANVTTLEARPVPPGSQVPPYTLTDAVTDALRLSPTHIIVGEVRRGDTAVELFNALMSDHSGMTTYHARGPQEAVFRLAVTMFAHAQVRMEAAKAMFYEALDLVVYLRMDNDNGAGRKRYLAGMWEVADFRGGDVKLRLLWEPGMERVEEMTRSERM